ncbi:hypothetical protein ACEWY4_004426 [Coilia grayii]|uniref:Fibronectin type-III domain-containing protein n=1 Tax=Coilia grayii TaxID=363190 RepID=A0ABD1KLM2_9TELE
MDDPSLVGEQLFYDIEIYNTGQKNPVHNDSVKIRPELAVKDWSWSWISPLPLECLQHSARLRVRHDNIVSNWTDLRNVTGPGLYHSSPVDEVKIYPVDDIVMAGSKKMFCCIIPNGKTLRDSTYRRAEIKHLPPVGQTYIFELTMQASRTGGDDLECTTNEGDVEGASVFVGYSPQVHNFTCETRNLVDFECSWRQGKDKNLSGNRTTKYTLNGSPVESTGKEGTYRWTISINSTQGEAPWTLTARNNLSETSFVYTANPRHRVYLPAPQTLQASSVNSTNARLEWQWPDANLSSLPMKCEVQLRLNSGEGMVRNATGINLHSVTLHDLHPYTSYSFRVRCAAAEHFWKWGNWSKEVSFQTKEDIPDNVDVWMSVDSNRNIFVVWKTLSVEKSHGNIIAYQLSWGGLTFGPTQHCYNMGSRISAGSSINIMASNSAGPSQPSTIMVPLHQADVETVRVSGSKGAVELSWAQRPAASCGYVVDWLPVNSQHKCDIKWKKIPAGHNSTRIESELKDGVRYTFSLYACTSSGPKLLQKWEGYGQEQVPNEAPRVHAVQDGPDVVLTWKMEILSENQKGFIQGYVLNYSRKSMEQYKREEVLRNETTMQKRIRNLLADTYEFSISAFTSAGEGPAARTEITVNSQTYRIIVYSTISLGVIITLVLLTTLLCYQKRTWLKDKVYPDIPAPQLVFSDSKVMYNDQLLKLPAEHVECLMAFPMKINNVNLKVTNGVMHNVYSPLYGNVTDSQQSQAAVDDLSPDVVASSFLFDNPTYNRNACVPELVDAPLETTEGYKPQLPIVSSHLDPCSASSYQDLDQCNPLQSSRDSHLESDDYIAVSVVGSPASVSSSQPLLGEPYKYRHGQHT